MSQKTLRRSNVPAIVPATARSALKRTPLVASIAGLLALAPMGSFALELGPAILRSALGQPLAVEISYRLAAGEQLAPACIALAPAARADLALPTYSRVSRIDVTPTHLRIFGDTRVLDPLIGITVDVHCSTAARFARSYQLFVDPPARVQENRPQAMAPAPVEARTIPAAASVAESPRVEADTTPGFAPSARARGQTGGALVQGQTYTIVRGDTLSGIASRVGDRPMNIRATAQAIFAANPAAFTRGSPDLLEAGRSITIPFMGEAPPAATAPAADAPTVAEPVPPLLDAEPPATPVSAAPISTAPISATPVLPSLPAATLPPPVADAASSVAADPPARAVLPAVDASPATAAAPGEIAARADVPTAGRYPLWLSALAAVGAAFLLSTPLLLLRRRRREAPFHDRPDPRSAQPRPLIDPAAGFDVVEGRLGRTQTNEAVAPSRAAPAPAGTEPRPAVTAASATPAIDLGHDGTVDLDIGVPVAGDERAEWFAESTSIAAASVGGDTLETAATALLPQPEITHAAEHALEATPASRDEAVDADEQHTLTIVELDMLRQDYEAEHTLTQASSTALQAAIADLKATQAARAADETATLEMPKQHAGDADAADETAAFSRRRA